MSIMENNKIEYFTKRFFEFGREIVPGFRIDGENKAVIEALVLYLLRHRDFEKDSTEGKLSLNKGIILIGNYGTGKTGLFRIMQRINNIRHAKMKVDMRFGIVPAWKVATFYQKDGFEAMEKYWSGNWCFDEIGKSNSEVINHYGTKINVSEQIILERYNLFTSKGLITHFTTNLSVQDLENLYDGRTISRLREMCNFIYLVGKDRRKTAIAKPLANYLQEKPTIEREEFYKGFALKYNYKDVLLNQEKEEPGKVVKTQGVLTNYIYSDSYRISKLKATFYEYCKLAGVCEHEVRKAINDGRSR